MTARGDGPEGGKRLDPDVASATNRLLAVLAGHMQLWVVELGIRLGLFKVFRRPASVAQAAAMLHAHDERRLAAWVEAAHAGGWLERSGPGGSFVLAPGVAEVLLDGDWEADLAGVTLMVPAVAEQMVGLRADLLAGRLTSWDAVGEDFLVGLGLVARGHYRRALEVARGVVPAPRRVLELGAGAGRGLLLLNQVYPKARLTALEPDPALVAEADRRVTAAGIRDRVTFLELPLDRVAVDQPADLALLSLGLHHLPDRGAVLAAIHRALADDGALVLSEFPYPETDAALRADTGRFLAAWQLHETSFGTHHLTPTELRELLEGAGFAVESSQRVHPLQHVLVARVV